MILLILLLIPAVIGLFAVSSSLAARVARLEARIDALAGGTPAAAPASTPPAAPAEPVSPPAEAKAEPVPDGLLEAEAARSESLAGLFERLVAGKLLIWIGGLALTVAGFLLIRFSIEIGLITPAARMVAAGLFGLALLGAGEYARAGRFADDPRIAQALTGAGLAILYGTFYASHVRYALIGSGVASAAMLAVTAAALVLSLRHGAAAAVLGLIGGFLTPLLVGNPDAGAVPLLAYLALLDLAVFVIAWRRGWTWLAAAATALSFVWSGYLLARPPADALASGVFVVVLALAAATARPGQGRQLSLIQPLAIAALQLAVLVARTDIGIAAWLLYGLLAAAAMALAALREECVPAPPVALVLALLLVAVKTAGHDPLAVQAGVGTGLLFGGGGLALALWRPRLLWTAVAAIGAAGPLLILRGLRPDLLEPLGWGLLAALAAAAPALLAWRRRAGESGQFIAGAAAALLLGAAVWDLVPADWIGAGWLAAALGAALAARRLDDRALANVAALAAAIGLLRCLYMLPNLAPALFDATIGKPVLAGQLPGTATALTSLAIPALLFAAIHAALPQFGWRRAAAWAAGLLALAALYCWYKQAWALDAASWPQWGLLERTLLTQLLFLVGWLFAAGRVQLPRLSPAATRRAGEALTALAAARLVWFDLLTLDPAWREQWVGPLPALNLILPAYLASAAWLYLARRRAAGGGASGTWLALFLAALVVGIALLVRQAFHGAILTGAGMPRAEFYGYSLAGLLVAAGLILAGMKLADKALRIAGLLLLTATICKVFLVDAAELKGVLRILSFLGLGVALIGIGRLYGPVLRAEGGGALAPAGGSS